MLSLPPSAKLKSNLKSRFDDASLPSLHNMAWLNYRLFLLRLAKLSADKAKADKSAVIRKQHVQEAAKTILSGIKG
ncbi:hypothetical protein ACF0H5_004760 [Mactra antiquata]